MSSRLQVRDPKRTLDCMAYTTVLGRTVKIKKNDTHSKVTVGPLLLTLTPPVV